MARPRSVKVAAIKERMLARLADPLRPAGARFLSARAVASLYGVSYQTAHRLLAELQTEGKLTRRAASGTYRAGKSVEPTGVQLVFHERARREGSFGGVLLAALREKLARDRIDARISWCRGRPIRLPDDRVPILWESPAVLEDCLATRRSALLLNDRPPPGMDSLVVDSVGVDDFSGGACAAQLLVQRCGPRAKFIIVAGPSDDRRSIARVAGCGSKLGDGVPVIGANGWFLQSGLEAAGRVLRTRPDGVFCCNDRLAEGLMTMARQRNLALPAIVGFDDAPVAEALGLTTIAIPWTELASAASALVRRRLTGDMGAASHQAVTPRPVIRWQGLD